jgi:diguanylate cyclase (GGDEF)-like protein/PAS domain S-box-containing protein
MITSDEAVQHEIRTGVQRVLDHAPDGCFMAGPDGAFDFVNGPWCKLTAVDADDALGDGWRATVHPEDLQRVAQNWHDAVVREVEFAMEYRVDVGGVVPRWLAVTAKPVLDTAGLTAGFLGWVTDVTKKVELEKYLERALMDQVKVTEQSRRQEERFRLIVENTSEGIWQLDANHRTVFCNQRLAELLGCDVADLVGCSLEDVIVEDGFDECLRGKGAGERTLREVTLRHSDGPAVTVMLAAAALAHSGSGYDGSLLIASDHSELRDAEDRLHTVERQFQTVFERAPIGISIVGIDGLIRETNSAFAEMSGYTRDELVGQSSGLLMSDEDEARLAEAVVGEILERGGSHAAVDLQLQRKDGDERWVRVDTSIVADDAGVFQYSVSISNDITDKRLFEQHLVHEASHDHLTGIPNRALLRELLEQAAARTRRHHRSMTVMFVDLDRFKAVNDEMGHAAGDQVLIQSARRIANALRTGDVVARYGGDEFVVVCEDAGAYAGASVIADRIRHELGSPFDLDNGRARIGASIGIVISDGTDDIDRLLKRADEGLYRAKRDGGGRAVLVGSGVGVGHLDSIAPTDCPEAQHT